MPSLVIVTETLDSSGADWLADRAELVRCAHDDPGLSELLPRAEALVVRTYTQVNAQLLDRAPNLKVVGRAGVGLDNIDLQACRQRGVQVVYTPDANTQAVVEYVTGLIFDDLRPRTTLTEPVTPEVFHELRKTEVGRELADLTLGILGFGRIGKRLGKAARGLAVGRLLVNDLIDDVDLRPLVDYDYEYVDMQTLCEESDILTIHVDGRAENHHLLGAAVLSQLKPNCLFINAARGMLVDHAALADWASSHGEARIILDVHDPEPPAGPGEGDPLFDLPNVRLLPHLASRTDTALSNMSWVVRDVAAVLEGQQPLYLAD
jgi:phosphoglycerate dehydrogenase-like enzyme